MVDFDLGKLDPCRGLKDLSEAGTPDDHAEVDDPLQNFHITVLTCILSSTCDVFHCFVKILKMVAKVSIEFRFIARSR